MVTSLVTVVKPRLNLFNDLMFGTMWATILVCAVVSRAAGQAQAPWWSNAVYYRILVDSFKDGDGDGLGDLRGVTKQLSYVRAVGADAVILSPIVARSGDCTKPGTVNFSEIDQRYGTLDTFVNLIEKAKKLELKLVVTLPLQTISSESELFKSSAECVAEYHDQILWKDGTADDPPPAEEGTLTWKYHEGRNGYYALSNQEVILNLCSQAVATMLSAAQCAWLRRGVSGLLLDPDFLSHLKCGEQLLKKLAADAMSCVRGAGLDTPVILVESSLRPEAAAMYYGDGGVGANSVLSKALASPTRSAAELALGFHAAILTAPQDATPIWITSASNESRTATRYGSDMIDAINLLALILPGSPVIQQGDELGTADAILEWATGAHCWPNALSASSAPLPWDDTMNAGFTSGDPWIPLAPNYRYANAKSEYANDLSHLGILRVAAALRKSPAFGLHVEIKRINGAIAVLRWGGQGSLLLITNVAKEISEVQISKIPGLPIEMTVAASSAGSSISVSSHVSVEKSLKMSPGEAVLLAGGPRHCGGPGPVDKIANKLSEGWQKINKYFSNV